MIPNLKPSIDNNTESKEELQEILDFLSPLKSSSRESFHDPFMISGYKFEGNLGEGNSKVNLARHKMTKELVAIKCIEKKLLGKNCTIISKELLSLGSLSHPNICLLMEVIDSPLEIYMVLEYLSGGDLYVYIEQKGKLKEEEALTLFRQIISGVGFCHSQSIIHRDIKPENCILYFTIVVFDAHGLLKLCDFGFANYFNAESSIEEFCGSVEYAAPGKISLISEMLARKRYIGPEVDIWSMGVVLYVMVCGAMPFGEANISKLFLSIMTGNYTIPEFIANG
jgi:MAP/microtubule affinity-regulating kinase